MTKVRVSKSTTVETEIDVTFPLYQAYSDGTLDQGWRTFRRFDEDGGLCQITRHADHDGRSESWEIEKSRWQGVQGYVTSDDLTEDSSSSSEFEQAKSAALAFMSGA